MEPGHFVVLAVGIVVALLGAADFIAGLEHRHALGKEQGGQDAPFFPLAQCIDGRIVGWPFGIRSSNCGCCYSPSLIVLAVGLVVLVVVGDQIVQGEAVVARSRN